MRLLALLVTLLLTLAGAPAHAQDPQGPEHEALRKLKADVLAAINARNLDRIDPLLHKPFMATVVTQESFNDAGALKGWFEGLFTRNIPRVTKITMEADADEAALIYQGTFAVARGPTKERYELGDGRNFDMRGRWTAVAMKDAGQWKVLAIHAGINFLDNPVMWAIERSTLYFGAGGVVLGIVLGFLAGFFIRRRRAAPAA
jgi:ketosteroid isomerase-like protein